MEIYGEQDLMQKAANFHRLRNHLRPAGVGSMIFGALAVFLGIEFAKEDPINGMLIPLGIFLLVEGFWIIIRPRPSGMIIDGIALILIGIWNSLITLSSLSEGGEPDNFWIVLGIFQIGWGIQSIVQYGKYKDIAAFEPPRELMTQVSEIEKKIRKAKPAATEDIIDFRAKNILWRAGLGDNVGTFLNLNSGEMFFLGKDGVELESLVQKKKGYDGSFNVGTLYNMKGFISHESYDKFYRWKYGTDAPVPQP